ncbi:SDR family oxidoreductase [Candidatus Bipolaricaulota bacterium]|nr:SDR family oxidoreductase [Candidatus Bipolaricaulota bacterium]
MRVLVTGGAGYIGNKVVEELVDRGYEPVVFDMFYWGDKALDPLSSSIEKIKGDCRNSKDVIYALENVDAVIHLAGIVGEAACLQNHKAHFSINVESTRTLINICTDPELDLVRDFIFSSSCSVYGNVEGLYDEVTEKTPPHPLSHYANAKLRSENIILERSKEVSHFHPTVLRVSTVFGWSRRPRLDLVTNLFTYLAWKEGQITVYGDGEQTRSLIHVGDVARAFVDVLESPRFKRDGEIFHVGDRQNNRTVNQIAETVKSIAANTDIEHDLEANADRRDYSINCSKIKNIIKWKPQWSVEEGIENLSRKLEELDWDWESDSFRNTSYDYE